MELLLASNNDHKHAEFVRLFPGVRIVRPREIGVDFAFAEDGASFLDNALGKARTLQALAHRPTIGDDSGLCVAALGGGPGIRSSRYGSDGTRDLPAPARNQLLLSRLAELGGPERVLRLLPGAGHRRGAVRRRPGDGSRRDRLRSARRERLRVRPALPHSRSGPDHCGAA